MCIKVTSSSLLQSHFFEGRSHVFSGSSSLDCTHADFPLSFLWRIIFCDSLKSLQASLLLHQWGMMVDSIFCYSQSPSFFSQSPRFAAVLFKRVSSSRFVHCTVFCSIPLRKYSHPYDAGMAAGLRSWFGRSHYCG